VAYFFGPPCIYMQRFFANKLGSVAPFSCPRTHRNAIVNSETASRHVAVRYLRNYKCNRSNAMHITSGQTIAARKRAHVL